MDAADAKVFDIKHHHQPYRSKPILCAHIYIDDRGITVYVSYTMCIDTYPQRRHVRLCINVKSIRFSRLEYNTPKVSIEIEGRYTRI